LSQAGATCGIKGERSGLISEVLRLVETHATPWVLLENVPFMLQLGRGEAMKIITSSFERLGYKWAYRIVNSQAFGLPQRRRRVYFVACRDGDPSEVLFSDDALSTESSVGLAQTAYGFYWTEGIRGLGWAVDAVPTLKGGSGLGIPSSPAVLLSNGNIVTLDIRDAERLQGFPADWTRAAESVAKKGVRWKLVGNAVTVPAAAWIGRRMRNPGKTLSFQTTPIRSGHSWPNAAWNLGGGPMKVHASEWPVRQRQRPIEAFMRYDASMLSAKATSGFLRRTERARLRFPAGFLEAVRKHLDRVGGDPTRAQSQRDAVLRARAAPSASEVYAGP
jgi:DNA (cytosine-5)-methyltransferase 1